LAGLKLIREDLSLARMMPAPSPKPIGILGRRAMVTRRTVLGAGLAAIAASRARPAQAANYGPGVTDTEIKLGTTSPYSGPVSAYGVYGQAQLAYFRKVNDSGGINGRKVNLISLDNAYSPPKTLEQTRKLVESEGVFAIAGSLGTAPNAAVAKYLNGNGVPSLFLTSGAERFNDPANFPWIVPFYPTYVAQGAVFGKYILDKKPDARIAVHHVNDDLGKDLLVGLRKGLGEKASTMIVKVLSHETTDPTVDGQIVELKASGADVFVQLSTQKFVAQSIRKVRILDWQVLYIINSHASSVGGTLKGAGLENSKGLVTARWEQDPVDSSDAENAGLREYRACVAKYLPQLNLSETTAVTGYNNAFMIEQVLKRCGDELTRENLLTQATHLQGLVPPMVIPGVEIYNSPSNYAAFHNMQLAQFDGSQWGPIGSLISIDVGRQ
jgi:branched-chain amino acid transport system substrate-binding protein